METTDAPNHHHAYPGFAGVSGLVAALSMAVGRSGDSRLAARLTGVGPTDVVLDVGCGPGAAARHAARLGATVTGVDPEAVMLRLARLLSPRRITYVTGVAEALPVENGSVTVLWSIATVHHWNDVDAGLREAHRVLTPGGRLLAVEKRREPGAKGHASHGWTEAQAEAFAECCRAHGFDGVNVGQDEGRRGLALSVLARR